MDAAGLPKVVCKPVNEHRRYFYEKRDRRTIEYLDGRRSPHSVSIAIHAGEDACLTQAGQLLLVTLANQLARVHRNLHFVLGEPDSPLLAYALCDERTLGGEIGAICGRIDPFGSFEVDGSSSPTSDIAIGVGIDAPTGLTWYVGCDRSLARLARQPCTLGRGDTADLRGAGLAAILGAASAFKAGMRFATNPLILSAWNLKSGTDADPGPTGIPTIDVGRGLMVGAGAVGSAAMYWLAHWGNESAWTLVDGDVVALDNTNRCLMFFPDDAGWRNRSSSTKVACIAKRMTNVTPVARWYDEVNPPTRAYDTVVVVANERDVRTRVTRRNDPIQLQATTGRSWMSQLHRHILGRDDCVRCRTDDIEAPRLACGSVRIGNPEDSMGPDAALPFLSAASGLMLVSQLQRLQDGGFGSHAVNTWRWDFKSTEEVVSFGQHSCRPGCATLLPAAVRAEITGRTRWAGCSWLAGGSDRPVA